MGAPHCGRSGIGRPGRTIVNRLTPLQLRTARTLFALPAAAGFALAGGSALVDEQFDRSAIGELHDHVELPAVSLNEALEGRE